MRPPNPLDITALRFELRLRIREGPTPGPLGFFSSSFGVTGVSVVVMIISLLNMQARIVLQLRWLERAQFWPRCSCKGWRYTTGLPPLPLAATDLTLHFL